VRDQVVLQRFEETSSTKLELQNLLGALERLDVDGKELIVYTDSQNIVGLLGRRERFERNDYRTKKREKIANHELYKLFFQWMDRLSCTLIKVEGHKVSDQKDRIDELFTLVDRASRDKLRADI
jgi:ribonuclease HI